MRAAAAAALAVAVGLSGCHGGAASKPAGVPSLPSLPSGGAIGDGFLYAAVKARIAGTDLDASTHVSVVVHGGAVTLRGAVHDPKSKSKLVAAVRSMKGVKSVDDQLHVGRYVSLEDAVDNIELVAAVASSLTAQTGINVGGIKVHADRGVVTLTGHAPTAAIRSTLVAAAKHTQGVRNVVDRIVVK